MKIGLTFRSLFMVAELATLTLLGAAYVLEYHFQLEPCSLCLLQRYILWGIVLLLLAGILQNCKRISRLIYTTGIGIFSSLGIALAGRHVWLQHLPPSPDIPTCTAGIEKMLAFQPLLEVLKAVLTESQSCARVDFTILGFSLSFWSLMYFIALLGFSLVVFGLQIKRRI
jgi:disulfide bond formation protein DsbB